MVAPPIAGMMQPEVIQEDDDDDDYGMKCAPMVPPLMTQYYQDDEASEVMQKTGPLNYSSKPGTPAAGFSSKPGTPGGYMRPQAPGYGGFQQQFPGAGAYGNPWLQQGPAKVDDHPVQVKMFIQGVDYSSLKADTVLSAQFEQTIKNSVANGRDVRQDLMSVELAEGSVVVKTGMSAASGDSSALLHDLRASQVQVAQAATQGVKNLPGIEAACNGEIHAAILEVKGARGTAGGAAAQKKKKAPPAAGMRAAPKRRPQKPDNLDNSPETGEMLIRSAKAGEASKLQRLLAVSADPDAFGAGGRAAGTAIFYAADGGHLEAVDVLVQAMADVNITANGITPMQAAFTKGHKDVLQKLFGATFNSFNSVVTQSGSKAPQKLPGEDDIGCDEDEVPISATDELAAATKRLAASGKNRRDKEEPEDNDGVRLPSPNEAELAREAAMKGALKTIARRGAY